MKKTLAGALGEVGKPRPSAEPFTHVVVRTNQPGWEAKLNTLFDSGEIDEYELSMPVYEFGFYHGDHTVKRAKPH